MMLRPPVRRSFRPRNAQTPSSIGFHREANSTQFFAAPRDAAVIDSYQHGSDDSPCT
jgi:hypothetical protein